MVANVTPFDQVLHDFRIAVAQDCMGWFCERYGIGRMEFEAATSVELIAMVADWLRSQEKKEKS
jgi:hypothetical protein